MLPLFALSFVPHHPFSCLPAILSLFKRFKYFIFFLTCLEFFEKFYEIFYTQTDPKKELERKSFISGL
ncbi:MAG: hypothetical protein B5M56_07990 [Desulfococcus sp. 4484_241]|nr:MAG: hypothetical protein B5M56_07990 [Desulfococcus sp. 4484_241]